MHSEAARPDPVATAATLDAAERGLSVRSAEDDDGTSSSDDYSIASVTMSVQSEDDLPPSAPRCLRCFPTGAECLRFYVLVFISAIVMLSGALTMILRPDDAAARCVATGLMTTVMSFWIQPPSIGVARPKARRAAGRRGVS